MLLITYMWACEDIITKWEWLCLPVTNAEYHQFYMWTHPRSRVPSMAAGTWLKMAAREMAGIYRPSKTNHEYTGRYMHYLNDDN